MSASVADESPSEGCSEPWEEHAKLFCGELNEKHRRWLAGLLSEVLGWGGTKRVSQVTGLDEKTIRQGRLDLSAGLSGFETQRIRRAGGGRPGIKKRSELRVGSANAGRTGNGR